MKSDFKTPDLLAACDVAVMHELSMSLADTIVMGRPAIAISHPEFPSGSFTINHPAWAFKEAWWLVRDAAELRRALMVLTRDEHARQGGQKTYLPGLTLTAGRPYFVLTFALWATELGLHLMQRRTLRMLAEALPHDAFLVCKLHPSFEERETCEALLSASLPSNAFKVVGESDFKTPDLLTAALTKAYTPLLRSAYQAD